MSALHKDERSKLMEPHFEIMHKIFMGNVVRLQDVEEFDKMVKGDEESAAKKPSTKKSFHDVTSKVDSV
jgi:hypothetical protein